MWTVIRGTGLCWQLLSVELQDVTLDRVGTMLHKLWRRHQAEDQGDQDTCSLRRQVFEQFDKIGSVYCGEMFLHREGRRLVQVERLPGAERWHR